ncbi:MAG: Ig-like domain-containing protein [Blastocatellia bacterium]|nr:Ig-like domain-containing protein [Blastocatellia bacterium]
MMIPAHYHTDTAFRTKRFIYATIVLTILTLSFASVGQRNKSQAQSGPVLSSVSPAEIAVGEVPKKIVATGSGFTSAASLEISKSGLSGNAAGKVTGTTKIQIKGKQVPAGLFAENATLQVIAINADGSRSNAISIKVGTGGGGGGNSSGIRFVPVDPVTTEGGTLQLRAEALDAQGNPIPNAPVTFQSNSPEIASVSSTGLVSGVTRGFATITAQSGNSTTGLTVTVTKVERSNDQSIPGEGVLVTDQAGRIYVSNTLQHIIRRRNGFLDTPQTFAGRNGQNGRQDGQRLQALFNTPVGIAIDDRSGNIYIADTVNNVIRAVLPNDTVVTMVGSGVAGSADGPLTSAQFRNPRGIELDRVGNLYVSDTENHTIRYIDFTRRVVTTVAGAAGQSGLLDGTGSNARFNRPVGLKLDQSSQILNVADSGNNAVRQVSMSGVVKTISRANVSFLSRTAYTPNQQTGPGFGLMQPQGIGVDAVGNVYVGDQNGIQVLLQRDGQFFDGISLAPASALGNPSSFRISINDAVVLNTTGSELSRVTIAPPEITLVTPSSTPIRTSAKVTIIGRNFAPDSVVLLDGIPVQQVTFESTRQLTITTPMNESSGLQTLTVQHRGGIAQTRFSLTPPDFGTLSAGSITTVIGGSRFVGDGGMGSQAVLNVPSNIHVDGNGNLLIADTAHQRVRRFDVSTGIITTILGTGQYVSEASFLQPNQLATATPITNPYDAVLDNQGNIYAIDNNNLRIIKVDGLTNVATVFAGNGNSGFVGDGGPALQASFASPIVGLAIDPAGNLFVLDGGNQRIRKISPQGIISTVAGTGRAGNFGDGGPAKAASIFIHDPDYFGIFRPIGAQCSVDADGNFYFPDSFNFTVRRIDARTGVISRVAGTGSEGTPINNVPALSSPFSGISGVSVTPSGDLLITDYSDHRIWRVEKNTGLLRATVGTGRPGRGADGVQATVSDLLFPVSAVSDGAGNIYIADTYNNRVRVVDAQTGLVRTLIEGDTQTMTGDGGPATNARLVSVYDVAIDRNGTMLVADYNGARIRRTLGGSSQILTIAGDGQRRTTPITNTPALSASILPSCIDVLKTGEMVFMDILHQQLYRINTAGNLILLAGTGDENGSYLDGVSALSASFFFITDVVADGNGNLFLCEQGAHRIRRIDAQTGIITTVAGTGVRGDTGTGGLGRNATLNVPSALAFDRDGNLFIADSGNNKIKRVDAKSGIITTVAGTGGNRISNDGLTALNSDIPFPAGIAVDNTGNLFIADFSMRVRKVTPGTQTISTVAGNAQYLIYKGEGGRGPDATVSFPGALVLDRNGNLLVSEIGNNRVRALKGVAAPVADPGVGPTGASTSGNFKYETEPNDTPQTAQVINVNDGLIGNLAPNDRKGDVFLTFTDGSRDGIEDLYKFTLTRPTTVSIEVDWVDDESDVDVYLFNGNLTSGNGFPFQVDESNTIGGKPEIIAPQTLPAGTYYIGVSLFDEPGNRATLYGLAIVAEEENTAQTLSIDDGRLELGFQADPEEVFINQLTPPSYPATINQVAISFNNRAFTGRASSVGVTIGVYVLGDPNRTGQLEVLAADAYQITNDGTTADFATNLFITKPATLPSGDFYVGFQLLQPNSSGTKPLATIDTTTPRKRSFYSKDNGKNFVPLLSGIERDGNLLIRAQAVLGNGRSVILESNDLSLPATQPLKSFSGQLPVFRTPLVGSKAEPSSKPMLTPQPRLNPKELRGLRRVESLPTLSENQMMLEIAENETVSKVEANQNAGKTEVWEPVEIIEQSFDQVTRRWRLVVKAPARLAEFRYVTSTGTVSNRKSLTSPQ